MKPSEVPDDMVEITAAALCNNDNHGATWDRVRHATADRYRRLAARALTAVLPEHERQVRAKVVEEIEQSLTHEPPVSVGVRNGLRLAVEIARAGRGGA